MKEKVFKIIFILSFIPYIFLLGCGIYSSIEGFVFMSGGTPTYGLEGFSDTILIMGYIMIIIYPIIPACLIYEIVYLIIKKRKNKKIEN